MRYSRRRSLDSTQLLGKPSSKRQQDDDDALFNGSSSTSDLNTNFSGLRKGLMKMASARSVTATYSNFGELNDDVSLVDVAVKEQEGEAPQLAEVSDTDESSPEQVRKKVQIIEKKSKKAFARSKSARTFGSEPAEDDLVRTKVHISEAQKNLAKAGDTDEEGDDLVRTKVQIAEKPKRKLAKSGASEETDDHVQTKAQIQDDEKDDLVQAKVQDNKTRTKPKSRETKKTTRRTFSRSKSARSFNSDPGQKHSSGRKKHAPPRRLKSAEIAEEEAKASAIPNEDETKPCSRPSRRRDMMRTASVNVLSSTDTPNDNGDDEEKTERRSNRASSSRRSHHNPSLRRTNSRRKLLMRNASDRHFRHGKSSGHESSGNEKPVLKKIGSEKSLKSNSSSGHKSLKRMGSEKSLRSNSSHHKSNSGHHHHHHHHSTEDILRRCHHRIEHLQETEDDKGSDRLHASASAFDYVMAGADFVAAPKKPSLALQHRRERRASSQ